VSSKAAETGGAASVPPLNRLLTDWMRDWIRNRVAVNPKDGSVMVYVPAGEVELGDGARPDRPKRRVFVSPYWISVYAVNNAQYGRFVAKTKHRPPDDSNWSGAPAVWRGMRMPGGMLDHPVVCVSWDDAKAYADWAGCELPSEAQWEKAARGPAGFVYPWGERWDASRCRSSDSRGRETTCPVGAYPRGVSGYGTYNQSGNVLEWCADWYAEDYYAGSPAQDPVGPVSGNRRVRRGGGWRNSDADDFRATYRDCRDPAFRYGNLGFRIVKPAPVAAPEEAPDRSVLSLRQYS